MSCKFDGICVVVVGCTFECAGKDCGSDGCGGICGGCVPGVSCNVKGQCVQMVGCMVVCMGK